MKKIGGARKVKGGTSFPTLSQRQIRSFTNSLKVGDLIQIQWIDAFSEKGWIAVPEMTTAHPCAVCGYYINTNAGYVRIGINKSRTQTDGWVNFSDHWGIPEGMIFGMEKFSA